MTNLVYVAYKHCINHTTTILGVFWTMEAADTACHQALEDDVLCDWADWDLLEIQ